MLRRIFVTGLAPLVMLAVAAGIAQAKPVAATPAAPAPTLTVTHTGFNCPIVTTTTKDSASFTETYTQDSQALMDDMVGCVTKLHGTPTVGHTMGYKCKLHMMGHHSKEMEATFADGEAVRVCERPDLDSAGQTQTHHIPLTFVAQGFKCQATVGTGTSDQTATNIRNEDSLEFDQTYTGRNGEALAAITTACVGKLPSSTKVASTIVSHEVGCSQDNPFGTGTTPGYGESFTFPNRQYEEICSIPNYAVSTVS